MGVGARTLLLDTHVLQWWSAELERLSEAATDAIAGADELAVAGISGYELAWLAEVVRTVGVTPAIAHTALALSSTFPGDPGDRLIYATAVECGWPLVNKDRRLREHS